MQEITKPNQTVMIDPNEPLILPDGTALTGRIEWFLYSLCLLDYENLPTPMSRIEQFANALVTGEVPNIEPQSRVEEYFLAILTGDVENLPEPESRAEVLLNKLARGEFDLSDVEPIQSRYELLIAYLIKNSGIGDITYVLHEFLGSDTPYTMYNTKEKPTKSAILSGQTLVNITSDKKIVGSAYIRVEVDNNLIKPNVQYTLIVNGYSNVSRINCVDNNGLNPYFNIANPKQWNIFTTPNDLTNHHIRVYGTSIDDTLLNSIDIILIEGDYTNTNIPYFTGMQSVRMPVLTTTGKNLFEIQSWNKDLSGSSSSYVLNDISSIKQRYAYNQQCKIFDGKIHIKKLSNSYIIYDISINNLKANTKYVFSCDFDLIGLSSQPLSGRILNYRDKYFYNGLSQHESMSFTTDSNGSFNMEFINLAIDLNSEIILYNFQIEEGSTATSYEPYKSNILTVNESIELRGIGNGSNRVEDELDCLTGEVVERIGEVVLDGSEGWWHYKNVETMENTFCLSNTIVSNILGNGVVISNSYSNRWWYEMVSLNPDKTIGNANNKAVYIIDKSCSTLEEFTNYLQQQYINGNPVIIQYPLSENSIKTVGLSILDQDGATVEKLNTFKDITHVSCSVDKGSIYPYVEMEVATSNDEDLAAIGLKLEEKNKVQSKLIKVNDYQSDVIDNVMLGITEIYESI